MGGGTAGHITPLLAVAEHLNNYEVHAVTQRGDPNQSLFGATMPLHLIRAGKYRRYHGESFMSRILDVKTILLNIRDALFLIVGTLQALRLLKAIKPSAVFIKGGYVGVPVGIAAGWLGIPYITHDSDVIPGLANRLIAKKAYKHAVAYPGIDAYPKEKQVITGIPLAREFYNVKTNKVEVKARIGVPESSLLLVVFSGTQGSRSINQAVLDSASYWLTEVPNLYIYHVFGRLNTSLMDGYEHLPIDLRHRVQSAEFISNAVDILTAADLVVGRAGATTLAELAVLGKAAIVIPADHLSGGHQIANAELLQRAEACVVVREKDLPSLRETTLQLLSSENVREQLAEKMSQLAPHNSAEAIASLLSEVVDGRK